MWEKRRTVGDKSTVTDPRDIGECSRAALPEVPRERYTVLLLYTSRMLCVPSPFSLDESEKVATETPIAANGFVPPNTFTIFVE